MTEWPELVKSLTSDLRELRGGAPEVMKAFSGIAQAALSSKALDGKTKELIALGISVAVRCDAARKASITGIGWPSDPQHARK